MQEIRETTFRLLFLEKATRQKQLVRALVSTYFGSPLLGHTIKSNYIKFQTANPEICSVWIFRKESGTIFLKHILFITFCEKYFSHDIL